ncbi:hypothetical protein ACFXKC_33245 [Streptomyces sp. NPDC059340]|uniref:hypothetical protein n=1 Tax=Streptomyces sp. NPDC059340 TaxID=3346806 RepID=UPI0036A6C8E5
MALTAAHRASDARHLLGVHARDAMWEASAVVTTGSPYRGGPDLIELGHLDDNGFRRPAQFDGRHFSTEVAGDAVSCRRHRWARHINPRP